MSIPLQLDLERDICQDYALQVDGKFVHSRDFIASKYGVSTDRVSKIAHRHGFRRYTDNHRPRKAQDDASQPTRFSCPFCGFICESPAGHEVCR